MLKLYTTHTVPSKCRSYCTL